MQDNFFEIRQTSVNGRRVRQARELRGLTQSTLADALGIDQTMIAHVERSNKQPSEELLDALAAELAMPVAFFRQGNPPSLPNGSLLFRSKSGIGKRAIAEAHAHAEIVFEFVLRLAQHASLIPVRLPSETDSIEAAHAVRATLRLQDEPIPNLVRTIERLGVIVIPLPELRDCDAFAVWAGQEQKQPVIGMVVNRPRDRIRMSLAHELGHLMLHRDVTGATPDMEKEAYRFAAEFLTPSSAITDEFRAERVSLFRLAGLKKKWGVSMQALARRARELGVISDRQYRYLMQQMSMKGWRLAEPSFSTEEKELPRAIRKLTEVALSPSIDIRKVAREFNLSAAFLSNVFSNCASSPEGNVNQPNPSTGRLLTLAAKKKQRSPV